jgi:hypothetical protein
VTDAPVEASEPEHRPGRSVPAVAFVAAVMVAAVLGILALVSLSVGGSGEGDDSREARLAAGRFAERFLTFEHDEVDDWKADVLALSTGGFSEEVEDVEDGLRQVTGEAELVVEARVTDIFIGEIDRGAVEAVLIYDRDLRDAGGTRRETDRYMQLSMLQVDGEWLVDEVVDIATAGGLGGADPAPAEPSSTSTTAAGG